MLGSCDVRWPRPPASLNFVHGASPPPVLHLQTSNTLDFTLAAWPNHLGVWQLAVVPLCSYTRTPKRDGDQYIDWIFRESTVGVLGSWRAPRRRGTESGVRWTLFWLKCERRVGREYYLESRLKQPHVRNDKLSTTPYSRR